MAACAANSPVAKKYTIEPVDLARRRAEASMFLHLTDAGREVEIAYRLWLLRRGDRVLAVDTGPPVDEAQRRGCTGIERVAERLAQRGVDPGRIDTVILSHLHWDHAANAEAFPNACFLAQRAEIEFFASPMRAHKAVDRFFSHHAMIARLIDQKRIVAIDGDVEAEEGIATVHVGGHTPGSQMVKVDTADGLAVITVDAGPLHRNFIDSIPSGILVDLEQAIAALAKVRALRPRRIYTGHDLEPFLDVTEQHLAQGRNI